MANQSKCKTCGRSFDWTKTYTEYCSEACEKKDLRSKIQTTGEEIIEALTEVVEGIDNGAGVLQSPKRRFSLRKKKSG